MACPRFLKDPSDMLDWTVDWDDFLPSTDRVTASTWTISGSGLSEYSNTYGQRATVIWLTGGTVGRSHTVTNRIVTAEGRTVERSFTVTIIQR